MHIPTARIALGAGRVRPVLGGTGRRLLVVEQLQHVGCDQAVAFRAQIDQQQWLIYRSIGENANRTSHAKEMTYCLCFVSLCAVLFRLPVIGFSLLALALS